MVLGSQGRNLATVMVQVTIALKKSDLIVGQIGWIDQPSVLVFPAMNPPRNFSLPLHAFGKTAQRVRLMAT